jgi:hypothetical protein
VAEAGGGQVGVLAQQPPQGVEVAGPDRLGHRDRQGRIGSDGGHRQPA